jgi:hypothetical protein
MAAPSTKRLELEATTRSASAAQRMARLSVQSRRAADGGGWRLGEDRRRESKRDLDRTSSLFR